MKILLIDVNYRKGSTGKIVADIKNELESLELEAFAAYGRGKNTNEKNVKKISYDVETYFHALLSRISGLMGFFSFFSTYKLKRYIKKINPDVIHIL